MNTSTGSRFLYSELAAVPRKDSSVSRCAIFLMGLTGCIWASSFAIGFERAIAVLVAVGFLAAAAGLFQPVIGLFGIGILCTLDAISRFFVFESGVLHWNTLNYWLLLIMIVNVPLLLRFQPLPLQILVLFLTTLAFQLIYSTQPMSGLQHMLGIFITFGLVTTFLRGVKRDDVWIWLALLNGMVAAAGGFIYCMNKPNLMPVNANAASYFPLTGLFSICLGVPFAQRRRSIELALLSLAVANTGWVFLSGSRGSIFISLVCLLFIMHSMKGFAQRAALVLIGLLFLGVISARFGELKKTALHRIDKLFSNQESMDARTSGRSDIVRVGWSMFLTKPWGVGTGSFKENYAKQSSHGYIAFKPGRAVDAHAGWIKTLAENGLPGILLLATFVFSFAYIGLMRRKAGLLPIGLLVTTVLAVAFVSTEFQGKGLWFLASGALILLARKRPMPTASK